MHVEPRRAVSGNACRARWPELNPTLWGSCSLWCGVAISPLIKVTMNFPCLEVLSLLQCPCLFEGDQQSRELVLNSTISLEGHLTDLKTLVGF